MKIENRIWQWDKHQEDIRRVSQRLYDASPYIPFICKFLPGLAFIGLAGYGAISGALSYQEVILTLILAFIILK